LYASQNIIRMVRSRRMRWAGKVARMGTMINAHKILDGKPEGNRPLGRLRRRREDKIRVDLRGTGWEDVDWSFSGSEQGPVAGCCKHGNEPSGFMKGGEFLH
jgi:hypothetical protein